MTVYWVDPLDGDSANSGTTYTDAFGSFLDIFDGSLVGGLTRGDLVNLIASTADNVDTYITVSGNRDDGDYMASLGRDGTTSSWKIFHAVNPTTLQEDGTKYILGARNDQYATMMGGAGWEYYIWNNIEFVGFMHSYTSGAYGMIFNNCIFSDGHPSIQNYTGPIQSMYVGNQNHSFTDCLFINRGYNSNHDVGVRFGGGLYSGPNQVFSNCEFRNFSEAACMDYNSQEFYNCRFINNGYALKPGTSRTRNSYNKIINCIFEGNDVDYQWPVYYGGIEANFWMKNIHINCGGYNIEFNNSGTMSLINERRLSRSVFRSNIYKNVYQNSTSGFNDVPMGSTLTYIGWYKEDGGWTSGSFGLTFDPGTSGPSRMMVATGDAMLFRVQDIGTFLESFTEAVVQGSPPPEFGDMF